MEEQKFFDADDARELKAELEAMRFLFEILLANFCSASNGRGELDRWLAMARGGASALMPRLSHDDHDAEALADITLRTREIAFAMLDRAKDTALAGTAGGRSPRR